MLPDFILVCVSFLFSYIPPVTVFTISMLVYSFVTFWSQKILVNLEKYSLFLWFLVSRVLKIKKIPQKLVRNLNLSKTTFPLQLIKFMIFLSLGVCVGNCPFPHLISDPFHKSQHLVTKIFHSSNLTILKSSVWAIITCLTNFPQLLVATSCKELTRRGGGRIGCELVKDRPDTGSLAAHENLHLYRYF